MSATIAVALFVADFIANDAVPSSLNIATLGQTLAQFLGTVLHPRFRTGKASPKRVLTSFCVNR